jgi:CPA1 family monovalent cation:H+ antiporter
MPSAYLPRLASRGRLPPWKWVLFVGWAGMRGGDSLVLALALPLATRSGAPFPARDLIIFLTFSVIFATLVLQAVTLAPLLRFLGLSGSEDDDKEEAHARRVVAEVALQRLEKARSRDDVPLELLRSLRKQLEKKAIRWSTRDVDGHGRQDEEHRAVKRVGGPEAERESRAYRKLHGEILDAEREAVVKLRDQNVISDQVMHRVLRDIDLETMVVEATEDDAPSSPYDFQ